MMEDGIAQLSQRVATLTDTVARIETRQREMGDKLASSSRVMMGFVGEDNKLYPGILGRLANVESKMDVATRALVRVGTWGVRLLAITVVLLGLQIAGIHFDPAKALELFK